MTMRFSRLVTFGPVVTYHDRHTWTEEVKQLYKRLQDGDPGALAPLLAIDIEFVRDSQAMRALVTLKNDPAYPAAKARSQLRKIANVMTRRPRHKGKLPPGDLLLAELKGLTAWIEQNQLLALKTDEKALRAKIEKLLTTPLPRPRGIPEELKKHVFHVDVFVEGEEERLEKAEQVAEPDPFLPEPARNRMVDALVLSVRNGGYARRPRSWALGALAEYYNVDRKQIEKRIQRDPIARIVLTSEKSRSPAG